MIEKHQKAFFFVYGALCTLLDPPSINIFSSCMNISVHEKQNCTTSKLKQH